MMLTSALLMRGVKWTARCVTLKKVHRSPLHCHSASTLSSSPMGSPAVVFCRVAYGSSSLDTPAMAMTLDGEGEVFTLS